MLAVVLGICFLIHTYLAERVKKKVAYVMHISERTEEAETLDFAVNLFEDESMGKWAEKLERAYSIAEARRGFNNQRMMADHKRVMDEAKAQQEAAKEAAKKPTLLNKA